MLIDRSFTDMFQPAPRTGVRKRTLATRSAVDVTIAVGNELFTASTSDLTTTAVFVVTSRVIDVGAQVAMAIDLPEGEVLARGTVRAIRHVGEGEMPGLLVGFDLLATDDHSALASFCAA